MTIVDLSCCGINIGIQATTRAEQSNHIQVNLLQMISPFIDIQSLVVQFSL